MMGTIITWMVFLWSSSLMEGAPLKFASHCIENIHREELKCIGHLPDLGKGFHSNAKSVLFHDIDWDIVDMNALLEQFPDMGNLSVYNGNISEFVAPQGDFKDNHIRILQLRKVSIRLIKTGFLASFPKLEELDLRENHLQNFPAHLPLPNLRKLFLAGNHWNCSLDLNWVLELNSTLVQDLDSLVCYKEPHSNKSLFSIAVFMKEVKDQCPQECTCSLPKAVRNPVSELLEPLVLVNCSYRALTHLPAVLPKSTKELKLEGNDISDLEALKYNPIYREITDIYLDNNKIKSIEVLEGSYWMRHFRVLSLNGNKLSELPTYAMDNALGQNANMPSAVRIYLGGNPWRCDCVFTPVFQEMLQKFSPQIRDISEVKCSYVEGDENSQLPIIGLSRSSVCRLPTEYSVQALDLLNGVLASLIILILSKLAYDYYYFKKTGRLPWIVTKMP